MKDISPIHGGPYQLRHRRDLHKGRMDHIKNENKHIKRQMGHYFYQTSECGGLLRDTSLTQASQEMARK